MSKLVINSKFLVAGVTALLSLGTAHSVIAVEFSQTPLFLAQPVRPILMLNLSNDHQLYFKVYDDYSDLDGDGVADTTYKNEIDYFGYFNSDYCYKHSGGVFEPTNETNDHYCSGDWSGNFLNWATMTRMDAVRKILYGGKRVVDEVDETVLERAFLPQDAHSFAKYYNGSDLGKLTPYGAVTTNVAGTSNSGLTICNTTEPNSRDQYSQQVTAPPLMRVAQGNYSLWASNEAWQCRWGVGTNGNDSALTGIHAFSSSPAAGDEYVVRVKSCVNGKINSANSEKCRGYAGGSLKPSGVLQEFGENDSMLFGLITGSYNNNKKGGVLRKNVGSITDEMDLEDGTFAYSGDGAGIIGSLDAMRIVGYSFSNGQYNVGDSCPWISSKFDNGKCTNWGNPQSEIYLESLRYLAGEDAVFATDDSNKLSALEKIEWKDPINDDNFCSPLAIMQFNASTSSYDHDDLSTSGLKGAPNLDSLTNKIGISEGIAGGRYFVGTNGADNNQVCTPKTITNLAQVTGTCPDAPRLEGGYQVAGLAYHARTEGIADGRETVQTLGVALAPAVPKIEINVPGSSEKVTILPACRETRLDPVGNCAIVDFKIIEDPASTPEHIKGSAFVNWESNEQGGDYDQDMWGMIQYEVTAQKVSVTTQVVEESTGGIHAFGYVISGTTRDGFHAHSGIRDYVNVDEAYDDVLACGVDGHTCNVGDAPSTQVYDIGGSSAKLLRQPLYYAAKWGGFDTRDSLGNETITEPPDGFEVPYVFATDPRELDKEIKRVFKDVIEGAGAAASVATNSTRLGTDTFVYQATFNSEGWFGSVAAKPIGTDGSIGDDDWKAGALLPVNHSARSIYTSNGSKLVDFNWSNLTDTQTKALNNQGDDSLGDERLLWLRGANVNGLRAREINQRMGDIVNSDPVFFGTRNYGFSKLTSHGGDSYDSFASAKTAEVVYVQANDGKLHAFNAKDGTEIFAFIPNGIYDKLPNITAQNYGSSVNRHVFTADGQITVSDVYDGTKWRTILAAGLGAGGEGVYVLDVTKPSSPELIGELAGSNIGHVTGKPAVVPLPSGKWAVVFGNGYKAGSNNTAKLIVAEIDGGSIGTVEVIDTNVGGDNGLAEPEFTVRGDGAVGKAYAGDLMGDIWRFDLSAMTVSKLFDGTADQPITAAPALGLNFIKRDTETGVETTMVYFGTGRYFSGSDLIPDNVATQSFYGLADTGITLTKNNLQENIIVSSGSTRQVQEAQNDTHATVTDFDWKSADTHGWYVDFPLAGERVVTKAMLLFDRLIFPTVVPTDNMCDYGGKSWIMELVGVGNLYPGHQMLENQGMENETLVSLSDLILGENSQGDGVIIQQNSDGSLESIKVKPPAGAFGRQSWRQLR